MSGTLAYVWLIALKIEKSSIDDVSNFLSKEPKQR